MLHMKTEGAVSIHREQVRRGKQEAALVVYKVPGPYQMMPLPGLPGQHE